MGSRTGEVSKRIDHSEKLQQRRLEEAEVLIKKWEADSLPWTESEDEAFAYLAAADDILAVMVEADDDVAVLDKAGSLLQLAMAKLEEEFRLVLIKKTVLSLDAERLQGSIKGDDAESSSSSSSTDGAGEDDPADSSGGSLHNVAVHHLREIAKRMIKSGYEKECCKVFTSLRKDVLDESFTKIGVEKVSIEGVQKMDGNLLYEMMTKWADKDAVEMALLLLDGEKKLCEKVFNGSELIKGTLFTEISKRCVMQLLNFGDAVAIAKRSSEKLIELLKMYDALSKAIPRLEELFSDESGEIVRLEVGEVLKALGEAVMGTFCEFEKQVQGGTSNEPVPGGDIHPLTRYVMNYVIYLVDYRNTLDQLFEIYEDDQNSNGNGDGVDNGDMSPLGRRLLMLTSSLEKNLEEKSRMYEDPHFGFIFLMNNITYMIQKVKKSELINVLGDHWIHSRGMLTRKYAISYFRGCWEAALSFLNVRTINDSAPSNTLKAIVKERFQNFNTCFEEIYRTQTGWKIQDPDLRKYVQLKISARVPQAYYWFLHSYSIQINESERQKYLKYSIETLANYALDLFEGVPLDLTQQRRES